MTLKHKTTFNNSIFKHAQAKNINCKLQGQGFGYGATQGQEVQGQGFGYGASQGQEAAALAALVSAGLQSHQGLVSPKKPVYHFTPIEPYRLVSPAAIPIDEPKQEAYEHAAVEQHEVPLAQAVHAEAHSFVDTPHNHLYKHEEHEDEVSWFII